MKGPMRADWISRAARIVLASIREIFDEAAYQRFLRRRKLPVSVDSYAQFLDEQAAATARRPRCC
jgi:hypothetical protein